MFCVHFHFYDDRDLATMSETHVGTIGQYGSWATEAVTLRHSSGTTTYITNLDGQTPVDPWVPASCAPTCAAGAVCCRDPEQGGGYCLTHIEKCDQMRDKSKAHGETVGVDLATGNVALALNTSLYWHLEMDPVDPNRLLVLTEASTNSTTPDRLGESLLPEFHADLPN